MQLGQPFLPAQMLYAPCVLGSMLYIALDICLCIYCFEFQMCCWLLSRSCAMIIAIMMSVLPKSMLWKDWQLQVNNIDAYLRMCK